MLTTNDPFDGAIIGKHRVQYYPPEGEHEEEGGPEVAERSAEERRLAAEKAGEQATEARSLCVQTGEIVVEVTSDGEKCLHDRALAGGSEGTRRRRWFWRGQLR